MRKLFGYIFQLKNEMRNLYIILEMDKGIYRGQTTIQMACYSSKFGAFASIYHCSVHLRDSFG